MRTGPLAALIGHALLAGTAAAQFTPPPPDPSTFPGAGLGPIAMPPVPPPPPASSTYVPVGTPPGLPPLPAVRSSPSVPPTGLPVGTPVGPYAGPPRAVAPFATPAGPTVLPPTRPTQPLMVSQDADPLVWFNVEFLMWFARTGSSPPLVQALTGPAASQAEFDVADARTLAGRGAFRYGLLPGVRLTLGGWVTPDQSVGVETSYVWFGTQSTHAGYQSVPGSVIGRPFFDVADGRPSLLALARADGTVAGAANLSTRMRFDAGDANALFRGNAFFFDRVTWLAGFRYLNLNEDLTVSDLASSQVTTGVRSSSTDAFAARNRYFAPQVGVKAGFDYAGWTLDMTGKLAFGWMSESATAFGRTRLEVPGDAVTRPAACWPWRRTPAPRAGRAAWSCRSSPSTSATRLRRTPRSSSATTSCTSATCCGPAGRSTRASTRTSSRSRRRARRPRRSPVRGSRCAAKTSGSRGSTSG